MNSVETIILLRNDQLQLQNNDNEADLSMNIEDNVLVNNDTITKLYQRVNQLASETLDEQTKERLN